MRHTIDAAVSAGFASALSKDISEKIAGCSWGRKRGSKAKSWVEVAGYSSIAAELGLRIFNTKMKCHTLQYACGVKGPDLLFGAGCDRATPAQVAAEFRTATYATLTCSG
ncbi:hypothetical protein BQ8794_590002 [Mesorhizobium prunaredense]|uniref:Uncharacterized protein n=1 Tax=Mesorhizobium prunaredense TaxID=1631249 RepID=A0A1R3VFR2_9HYPH|nr:hypothetical protein BQ8794_590002 [Mesorhizobium prunaredense]